MRKLIIGFYNYSGAILFSFENNSMRIRQTSNWKFTENTTDIVFVEEGTFDEIQFAFDCILSQIKLNLTWDDVSELETQEEENCFEKLEAIWKEKKFK